ncbi:L-aspartate oxidase [Bradyrhizobium sp. WD16]|uniref:L-aspartate oxidase n=1 Tax=Bradyrhizobium sp. WD16 TaxID=1521768 RepID=UPI0020A42190|nr:L-aspartate oxidase [Bradyrhizobium sp. WD16]UTD25730.1 L-aspartate oxidase [Bradyrhizobium sp. WD16]
MSADLHRLAGLPVIIGGGLAGLMTALRLAPMPVVLLSKGPIGTEASSAWAQGGLAASLGDDDDPALHLADTLAAGDGLCDAAVVERILRAAPAAIETLMRLGCAFDRTGDGRLGLGLEAAHSRRRIVHADGDGTGRELMRALGAMVLRTPSITVVQGVEARRLLLDDGAVAGLVAAGPAGPLMVPTSRVVVATGGLGGLFLDTTNPLGCFGQGLALAARAGAELADLEFIQFHPTAFDTAARPMKLISEAVRGEGAVLVDETGRRFLAGVPGEDLAPRDVVARAIWRHVGRGHRVFLDARQRPGAGFARRFPAIAAWCREAGIDPARQPIPVRPAAHYHMGGVAVDADGRSSVAGLWACGEVASTGLHGANRLASNSLTEAVVCAGCVADSVGGTSAGRAGRAVASSALPPAADPSAIRSILSRGLGVERDDAGLRAAIGMLRPLAADSGAASDPAAVGLMIAVMAMRRTESRGGHHRTDFPQRDALARRARIRLDEALAAAAELVSPAAMRSAAHVNTTARSARPCR